MKRIYRPASMALVMLMGLAGFSACSSDDDSAVDPSVTPSDAVKTTFTLSVGLPGQNSSSAKPQTRVSDATAQAQGTPVFRGIDNITLIPFGLAGRTSEASPVESSSQRLGTNITLPGTTANAFEATASPYNKVYANVSLPMGTSAFLFYGKAIDGSNAGYNISTDAEKHQYGTLAAANLTGDPADITFTPVQVNTLATLPEKATAIATYLTNVANTSIQVDGQTVTWATQNSDANPIYDLHQRFIQNQNGASNDVRIVMQTLYNSLKDLNNDMAKAIITNIESQANIDDNGNLTLKDAVDNYPSSLTAPIPEGVCLVAWDANTNSFTVNTSGSSTNGELTTKPSDLVYPANLQYYANTNISTSNTDQANTLTSATDWATTLTNSLTAGGQVTPSTQTVALTKQIQYAVARLDLTLSESASMKDYDGNVVTGTNGQNSSFPISAIFVGGQRQAKFDFTPLNTSSSATQYTIYDNVGPATNWYATLPSATAAVARTLALETPANEKVRVAIELTNNSGKDFAGKGGGIIYNGAKFYLVAELDPAATSGVAQPDGTTTLNQVFKQDFVTRANLTISPNENGGENGLGAAYNILPDLRNPQLSLGLSVNLEWQNGLTFNVVM